MSLSIRSGSRGSKHKETALVPKQKRCKQCPISKTLCKHALTERRNEYAAERNQTLLPMKGMRRPKREDLGRALGPRDAGGLKLGLGLDAVLGKIEGPVIRFTLIFSLTSSSFHRVNASFATNLSRGISVSFLAAPRVLSHFLFSMLGSWVLSSWRRYEIMAEV